MALVAIPKSFFDDHRERDLPTPSVILEKKRHYIISEADVAFDELVNDAQYYAHPDGPDQCPEVKRAAMALLKALKV